MMAVKDETYMHWLLQHQDEDNGEELVHGFAQILKPLIEFRKIRFKSIGSNFDSVFIGIR